jgi:hypothetical protein
MIAVVYKEDRGKEGEKMKWKGGKIRNCRNRENKKKNLQESEMEGRKEENRRKETYEI